MIYRMKATGSRGKPIAGPQRLWYGRTLENLVKLECFVNRWCPRGWLPRAVQHDKRNTLPGAPACRSAITTPAPSPITALARCDHELTSEASKRSVAIPAVVLAELRAHLGRFSEAGPDGLVFVRPNGARLRRLRPTLARGTHGRQGERRGRPLVDLRHAGNARRGGHGCQHQGTAGRNGTRWSQ